MSDTKEQLFQVQRWVVYLNATALRLGVLISMAKITPLSLWWFCLQEQIKSSHQMCGTDAVNLHVQSHSNQRNHLNYHQWINVITFSRSSGIALCIYLHVKEFFLQYCCSIAVVQFFKSHNFSQINTRTFRNMRLTALPEIPNSFWINL